MNVVVISSQRYLNDLIVTKKMGQKNRWIHISPPFFHNGVLKSVLLDGHHSLEACKKLGESPCVDIVTEEDGCEIELLFQGEIDLFLTWNKNEDEYYQTYLLKGDYEPVNQG